MNLRQCYKFLVKKKKRKKTKNSFYVKKAFPFIFLVSEQLYPRNYSLRQILGLSTLHEKS